MSSASSYTDEKPRSASASVKDVEVVQAAVLGKTAERDYAAERVITRKLDLRLIPMAFLIQLLCSIDRASIGNAAVAGLRTDLNLQGYDLNIALTIFYIAFTLVEVPSNLILRKIGAHIWLAVLLVSFGVITMLTAWVHNFAGLIVIRIALGIAEGGVMPGLALYLSRFYRRDELVLRTGLFVSGSGLAGAIGGLLASGLLSVERIGSRHSWQLIFLIEGIITAGCGVLSLIFLPYLFPSEPGTAKFLTPEERELAVRRIRSEAVGVKDLVEKTDFKLVWRAFGNANVWFCVLGFTLGQVSVQGLSLFMPSIVRAIFPNQTTVGIQLRSCPPFFVAWLLSILVAYIADRVNKRGVVIMGCVPLSIIGYAVFVGTTNGPARYCGAFLAAAGIFPLGPIFISWGASNTGPDTTRAVATALIVGMASAGSIVATWCYLPTDAPNYRIGNSVNLAAVSLLFCNALACTLYNTWENRQRAAGRRDHRLEGKSDEEIQKLGCYHPHFVLST